MNPWLNILSKITLSKSEQEVVKRFESNPEGRSFLAIADILKNHHYIDESLELLVQGVEQHPKYIVARVVLARELFYKGLMSEAWKVLDEADVSLAENILAQKLRFKLALVLNYEALARSTFHHMKRQQMVDQECNRLGDILALSGFAQARQRLLKDLQKQGTRAIIPADDQSIIEAETAGAVLTPEEELDEGVWSSEVDDEEFAGYHVMSLEEIFRPSDHDRKDFSPNGIELDSTTLAEIYESQQHYGKALNVYKRLLRMTPNNDFLRNKVADTARKVREQEKEDVSVDPSVVDKMEQLEIINRQMAFYADLLEKISR